jgi:hypothetical protein
MISKSIKNRWTLARLSAEAFAEHARLMGHYESMCKKSKTISPAARIVLGEACEFRIKATELREAMSAAFKAHGQN